MTSRQREHLQGSLADDESAPLTLPVLAHMREALRSYRDRTVFQRSDPAFFEALAAASEVEGYTTPIELSMLFHLARHFSESRARVVEIGSYLGRSTVVLAYAARLAGGAPVAAVDPHIGEMTREAWPLRDTRAEYDANLARAGIESNVETLQVTSVEAATEWPGDPVGLLFIDGLHTREAVLEDYRSWARWLVRDACVVFDDYLVYPTVRSAIRELRANELRGMPASVIGKMLVVGPAEVLREAPTAPAGRLLGRLGDSALTVLARLVRY